jgi:hypothetical protein
MKIIKKHLNTKKCQKNTKKQLGKLAQEFVDLWVKKRLFSYVDFWLKNVDFHMKNGNFHIKTAIFV